ncbi:alkaline phosphatase [Plectosphaerella cucumerina]|uniref:alkaline phosphatase n=1 Tax=Plectosphaerella cucumerina TaxID=40658 RepID=A0A8K0TEU9_9PEZI|nr:alkaline phosphatase [Plectosphaerella cucumerina]
MAKLNAVALVAAAAAVSAQTFQRLGSCPDLGCVIPPDQSDFLPGQNFDLRVEVHAPESGFESFNDGKPDEDFSVTIAKKGGESSTLDEFFERKESPELEKWSFSWFEDLYAEDANEKTPVNVASKVWRRLAIYEPGEYEVTLKYYGNKTTTANWTVRPLATEKKAKNIIFFIGDGMTTNMITAARLLGHKTVNGKYQSKLKLDEFPVLGHQMTHSIDTFITDSANSASALYTGHKSTVNAMGVYADSSPDPFDDPKVETIVELASRIWGTVWGAVSTAFIADATPIALTGHTRARAQYGPLIDQALNGVTNYSWPNHQGPSAYFGAGAEQFYAGSGSYQGKDYYQEFAKAGYSVSLNKTALENIDVNEKALGIFCKGNLPTWLDRNVYTDNLGKLNNDPTGKSGAALDLPGLKEMTLKAVEVLHNRGGDEGFFLMSEAASIDKQMHALDYDRALGDLLELDDTVRATIAKLEELGIRDETLIVVSADHGHGFDVFGNADTKYLAEQEGDRAKRRAVGVYQRSGLSGYQEEDPAVSYNTGPNFPVDWSPRYAIAAGFGAHPDSRENYRVRESPRVAATSGTGGYVANPADAPDGFLNTGTLPTTEAQGVHSLTDVMVYAWGPCQETFSGTFDNTDIFYKMANCFGLAQPKETKPGCRRKLK